MMMSELGSAEEKKLPDTDMVRNEVAKKKKKSTEDEWSIIGQNEKGKEERKE